MPDRRPARADASGEGAHGEIERTGLEAERLLEALESAAQPTRPASRSKCRPGCLVWLIAVPLALLGLPVLLETLRGRAPDLLQAPLGFQSSCGSADAPDGVWWPVLGPADPSLLRLVRRSYCGDAYINGQGLLQAASFATEAEAGRFARRLSAATGAPFRPGKR